MLEARGATYTYREYTQKPLTEAELRDLLRKLGQPASAILRKADAADAGLTGTEPEDRLIAAMAARPSLIQRPIGEIGRAHV